MYKKVKCKHCGETYEKNMMLGGNHYCKEERQAIKSKSH